MRFFFTGLLSLPSAAFGTGTGIPDSGPVGNFIVGTLIFLSIVFIYVVLPATVIYVLFLLYKRLFGKKK